MPHWYKESAFLTLYTKLLLALIIYSSKVMLSMRSRQAEHLFHLNHYSSSLQVKYKQRDKSVKTNTLTHIYTMEQLQRMMNVVIS